MFNLCSFHGGYRFRNLQGTPRADIQTIAIPPKIILSLPSNFAGTFQPIVQVGEQVFAGQVVARNSAGQILSSVHGKIEAVLESSLVISADSTEEIKIITGSNRTWENMSVEKISEILYHAGVAHGNFPILGQATSRLAMQDVKCLIISALATYPMSLPTIAACDNRLEDAAQGIAILRKLYGNVATFVAFSKRESMVGKTIQKVLNEKSVCEKTACCQKDFVVVRGLQPKYPQEMPEVLVQTLTKQVIPAGKKPESVGIVVLDLATALAVYDAVALGRPFIQKIVALCGTGFKDNLAIRVRIGTPLSEIFAQWTKKNVEVRQIHGHALLGDAIEPNMSITGTTQCLTCLEEERSRQFMFFMRPGFRTDSYSNVFAGAVLPIAKKLETNIHGEPRACIQCSYCEDICPCPLYPSLLHKYCTNNLADDALATLNLNACIECGLCSYICPSKIPIMTDIQKGKEELRKSGLLE